MALTPAQNATLKAYIEGDQVLSAFPNTQDGAFAIAALLNSASSPTFYVWRSSVTIDEVMQNGFDWTRVDNLTVGKRDSLLWLCSESLNPNDPNVRKAISDLCGTQNTLKNSLLAALKRFATRAEQALATGTGTDADPGTLVYEGIVSQGEASNIR